LLIQLRDKRNNACVTKKEILQDSQKPKFKWSKNTGEVLWLRSGLRRPQSELKLKLKPLPRLPLSKQLRPLKKKPKRRPQERPLPRELKMNKPLPLLLTPLLKKKLMKPRRRDLKNRKRERRKRRKLLLPLSPLKLPQRKKLKLPNMPLLKKRKKKRERNF